ncbi:class II glutamine amidotransferase [Nocardia terpenica]|uniref:class II glutamine amidotransferase n=1 Tax=Nocardia terpenica TaxID=455432 RepID=UPI0018957EC4|nr:class II glutamine amidotransferase [Nocardia terpenica]MBF6063552.1 class II glutamine amidotransferase [Nocardia terpenica]MBF6106108.1 class II glutamine amidotransferase [Nocardia terpenica]MBF6113307.1 class II glutamine amidotransferase [Nocardia terpenica]MBF6119849.1 class II glutamine amidotransferase [Nocardia terpenica]MBF6152260.1 class II glutamine amidotransferase [Nocardia terpenica]
MCLLTFYPAGIAPDAHALEIGAAVNPHGHGYAVATDAGIVTGHGMDARPVIEEFTQIRARYLDGPALFHSRYATHGVVGLGNCHPFRLGGDRRTVLAHNGILPKRVHPGPYDRRSDTRIAAEEYLPRHPFGSLDTHQGRRGLESWLGTSKLVVLTIDPAYKHTAYLFNEQAGIWDGEIWYSNTGYRLGLGHRAWWDFVCAHCTAVDLRRRGRYCGRCGWCFDCTEPYPDCTCVQPALLTTAHSVTATPPRVRALHAVPYGSADFDC